MDCRKRNNLPAGKCHRTRRGCQRANPWIEFLIAHGKMGYTRERFSQEYANAKANPGQPRLLPPPFDARFPTSNAVRESNVCPFTRLRQNPNLVTKHLGLQVPKQAYLTQAELTDRRILDTLPFFVLPPLQGRRFYLGKAGVNNPRQRHGLQQDVDQFLWVPREANESVHYGPLRGDRYIDLSFDELGTHNILRSLNMLFDPPVMMHPSIHPRALENVLQSTLVLPPAVRNTIQQFVQQDAADRAQLLNAYTAFRNQAAHATLKDFRLMRQYVKFGIHLCLYFRRWGGPGTRLPLHQRHTHHLVAVSRNIPNNARNHNSDRLQDIEARLCILMHRCRQEMSAPVRAALDNLPLLSICSTEIQATEHVFVRRTGHHNIVALTEMCCAAEMCVRMGSSDMFQTMCYLYYILFRTLPLGLTMDQFKRGVMRVA